MNDTEKRATRRAGSDPESPGFTEAEKTAMQERARELKAESRRTSRTKADGEGDLLAKISEMPESDRVMAERIHAIVRTNAPDLAPRTWYGMPAYARDGKVICFFQSAQKFDARYATFGFNDAAHLDEGTMWPTSWALTKLSPDDEARIAELVRKAVS